MFDYLKDVFEYYFDYSKYIKSHQQEHKDNVTQTETQNKQSNTDTLILKKNDGYKNINTNKIVDVLFDPNDIFV